MNSQSVATKRTFDELHADVIEGVEAMDKIFKAGEALKEIKKRKLYKAKYDTWENYTASVKNLSKTHANRIINTARIVKLLEPSGCQIASERQVRPLQGVSDTKIKNAAKKAKEEGIEITVESIVELIKASKRKSVPVPEVSVPMDPNGDPDWNAPIPLRTEPDDDCPIDQDVLAQVQQLARTPLHKVVPYDVPSLANGKAKLDQFMSKLNGQKVAAQVAQVLRQEMNPLNPRDCNCTELILQRFKRWKNDLDESRPMTFQQLMYAIEKLIVQEA